ncbi:zinc finger protein 846-like isoform X1 [Schistocerca serialis cubense]|uniref:zinc finger protein 846-like isoform X1 n=1 Tax=Schistocerca cancellata TaxID=274614 RepID=UPI002117454F|nr:zinc finger protein 846-like isoform X1 [Schistocerca cancellata]XP_049956470.1 zinc finger protein 846-like isoform X1 [Schistocerca serialis cubense]XP_049956471.1 zinc finger protein 846-like isoform X1 [Schistocerca serialis cubense]
MCGRNYVYKKNLLRHIRVECGKEATFSCMLAYSNMTSAWRLLARSGEDFQCLRCGKTYMHKGTLSRHVQYECGTVPRFTCRICGARNRRRYGLTNHLIMVHGVQKKQAELNITEKYIEKTEKFQ